MLSVCQTLLWRRRGSTSNDAACPQVICAKVSENQCDDVWILVEAAMDFDFGDSGGDEISVVPDLDQLSRRQVSERTNPTAIMPRPGTSSGVFTCGLRRQSPCGDRPTQLVRTCVARAGTNEASGNGRDQSVLVDGG
jgi:hypothetical protein